MVDSRWDGEIHGALPQLPVGDFSSSELAVDGVGDEPVGHGEEVDFTILAVEDLAGGVFCKVLSSGGRSSRPLDVLTAALLANRVHLRGLHSSTRAGEPDPLDDSQTYAVGCSSKFA